MFGGMMTVLWRKLEETYHVKRKELERCCIAWAGDGPKIPVGDPYLDENRFGGTLGCGTSVMFHVGAFQCDNEEETMQMAIRWRQEAVEGSDRMIEPVSRSAVSD
ncbi:hypothetical protein E3N88_34226 [Mikania micrantha]|uniref:Uncharacterized protein n=1 Tax=Mikania micrantha TaxID=192012 RepID=A0A5N6LYE4_9ASTR|nr:hypothetical protein E3N88_34226 [Mikania micrantha]